jgi:very-short-patch-repair endonuclease
VRRQHPVGAFVLDFYCEDLRLAIEVDGSIHAVPGVAARDADREDILRSLGIWFVRVAADATESEVHAVLAEIERQCQFI